MILFKINQDLKYLNPKLTSNKAISFLLWLELFYGDIFNDIRSIKNRALRSY